MSYHNPTTTTRSPVFSRLFTAWTDPTHACVQGLRGQAVKGWHWLDDVTAEFTLRPGLKYHNKPPVNGRETVAVRRPAAVC